MDTALNSLSLLLVFTGTYLSLRSIFISKIEARIARHVFQYRKWDEVPLHDRIIFQLFGINKDNKFLFMMYEGDLSLKNKKLKERLFDYWEPFRAMIYFTIALLLQGVLILLPYIVAK